MAKSDELENKALRPTREQAIVYFASAFLVCLVPLFLHYSIFELSLGAYWHVFLVVSTLSSAIMTLGYHNTTFMLHSRLAQSRSDAVTLNKVKATLAKQDAVAGGATRAVAASQKQQVAAATLQEAMAFSILYNNVFFLLCVVALGFYAFGGAAGVYNYVVSVSCSAATLTLVSAFALPSR